MKAEPRRAAGTGRAPLTALARASAGAGSVVLGAYLFSRLTGGRKRQARLDRLEAMLAELTREAKEVK